MIKSLLQSDDAWHRQVHQTRPLGKIDIDCICEYHRDTSQTTLLLNRYSFVALPFTAQTCLGVFCLGLGLHVS